MGVVQGQPESILWHTIIQENGNQATGYTSQGGSIGTSTSINAIVYNGIAGEDIRKGFGVHLKSDGKYYISTNTDYIEFICNQDINTDSVIELINSGRLNISNLTFGIGDRLFLNYTDDNTLNIQNSPNAFISGNIFQEIGKVVDFETIQIDVKTGIKSA